MYEPEVYEFREKAELGNSKTLRGTVLSSQPPFLKGLDVLETNLSLEGGEM